MIAQILFIHRQLVLSDVGRYIAPDSLLNRTVFDMDAVISSDDCLGEATRLNAETRTDVKTINRIKSADDLKNEKLHGSGSLVTSMSNPDFRQTSMTEDSNPLVAGEADPTQKGEEELPYLCFSSQFESGNLRKAVQVWWYYI